MTGITTDRGDILHFAGFHHLSPAVDGGGKPAFSAGSGDGLVRCGWTRFFDALGTQRLALERDPDDPSSARFVDAGSEAAHARPRPPLRAAIEHARRFWSALFPPPPSGGG